MGWNTVIFALNDLMHTLEKSPKTFAFMLAHPPHGLSALERNSLKAQIVSVAEEHNEPRPHPQALTIMPTFHADHTNFYMAGGNTINQLKFVKYGKTKDGKKTVTLELPEGVDA